ncbi:ROK family transcriptional regulator [Cereibacter sphaeroides]|uniref:ROK family transcriptional regulator n=1 Tax=Cereibacter sphaeroides TaxID=1063 RepID=UPI000191C35F|nr:ROK family transcriptional regulator [Cereibacter sphaeroides]ACM02243.1 ROK family protein [Cereibacter sphaeroides KD131]EKX58057.1 Transcriptional regulator FrcR for fructose utilization, ROK family [Rhodobacter sp. AKP1]
MRQGQETAERSGGAEPGLRGSNQSGMRAHNERLVLSLVRREGALAKSDIARMTGLSAQTVSVIMRELERDGLLRRGEPIRGRIGQPSVPMSLAPEGAYFLGLKIGRRSAELVLIDFLGRPVASRRRLYPYPTPDAVVAFTAETLPRLMESLSPESRTRVGGLGIAMPFQLWNWVSYVGAPQAEMDAWRTRDIQSELAALTGLPVHVRNDATAACGAELVFGSGARPKDFLYFYFAYFIGGGLVLNGHLFAGRTGNAAGVGPMPVPGRDGQMRRLLNVASMSVLAEALEQAGEPSAALWEDPERWEVSGPILEEWLEGAAAGLASAILSAAALVEMETVVIDGWMPPAIRADIVRRTHAALHRLDLSGIEPPLIREGTVGAQARALGAAAIPLSQRYLVEAMGAGQES